MNKFIKVIMVASMLMASMTASAECKMVYVDGKYIFVCLQQVSSNLIRVSNWAGSIFGSDEMDDVMKELRRDLKEQEAIIKVLELMQKKKISVIDMLMYQEREKEDLEDRIKQGEMYEY